jgi:hypothetical protein
MFVLEGVEASAPLWFGWSVCYEETGLLAVLEAWVCSCIRCSVR